MAQNLINNTIKLFLFTTAGPSGFTFTTVGGVLNTAAVTGNLDSHELIDLIAKCELAQCRVSVVAGVLTILPKLTQ